MKAAWFDRIPKVELHLHLEGAIPLPIVWELIGKYGGDPDLPDLDALRARYRYRDFAHFIATWLWQASYIREYEDFTLIAEAVARNLADRNIRYVEAFFSPPDFHRHGLETARIAEAVREGLDRVPETNVALVADLVRNYGPKNAERTLSELAEAADLGVIGIGIGGSEERYPPEPFARVFERARELGFRTSAHAGEVAGAASVWGAVRALRVDRIGHATRAHEDERLLDYLASSGLPLEMCPLSNVRTGAVSSLKAHPVRPYFDRGLLVTVNTDDPTMFGTTLAGELAGLTEQLGFTPAEIQELQLNAIRASWLSEERKRALETEFRADPVWKEAAL